MHAHSMRCWFLSPDCVVTSLAWYHDADVTTRLLTPGWLACLQDIQTLFVPWLMVAIFCVIEASAALIWYIIKRLRNEQVRSTTAAVDVTSAAMIISTNSVVQQAFPDD